MAGIEIQSYKIAYLLFLGLVMIFSALVVARDVVPLAPVPAETYDYLEHCGTKLKPACGESIRSSVYSYGGKLSEECCKQLLAEGKVCHDMFVNVTVLEYVYNEVTSISMALDKAAKVWNECEAAESKN